MKKTKVRCVRGYGIVGSIHNIEVTKPLAGFGYSKRLYGCTNCGKLFVLDQNNPNLKHTFGLLDNIKGCCPNCNILLKGHLFPHPENVFLSGNVEEMDASTIYYDRDSSFVEEFCEISV